MRDDDTHHQDGAGVPDELERLWKDCPTIDLGVVGTEQGGR